MFYKVFYAMKPDYEYRKNFYCAVIAENRIEALRQAFDHVPEADVWGMVAEHTTLNQLTEPPTPAESVIEQRFVGSMRHGITPCVYDHETEIEYVSLWVNKDFNEVHDFADMESAQKMADLFNQNWDSEKWRVGKRPTIERVHVSFWQTGERAGKFSSGAYEVKNKPRDGFLTIQLTDDKQLTVSVDRTRSVA